MAIRLAFVSISRVLSYLPLVWIVCVVGLYLRAYSHLGRWPIVSLDDPKNFPFGLQYELLFQGLLVVLVSIGLVPALWILKKKVLREPIRHQVMVFSAGWFAIFGCWKIVAWFLD